MADEEGKTAGDQHEGWGEDGAPLSDIAERVMRRTTARDEEDPDAPFSQQPYHELDADAVWGDTLEEESAVEGDIDGISREGEETFLVPKRDFCESCQYLSEPPEVECGHEGTTIHEFEDIGHVRVSNCPVVENLLRITR